ncbi:hypothetical protein GCM10019016_029430 [Streptomyces prasinosporus]|uniref:Uncharacterized protein n=1 Tax=Streptomyces prasinosporus TaxID=68256 RepID=A0ABP6TLI3_9ACTN
MHDGDRGAVPAVGEVRQHRGDRGHADPGGGQQQRGVRVGVDDQVAVGLGQLQDVADPHAGVQVVGHLALGRRVLVHALDAELPLAGAGRPGEAVLPYLPGAVREGDADGDVLPRAEAAHRAAVDRAQPEGHDVGGLGDPLDDLPGPPLAPAALLVQPLLDGDQGVRHQPVDLVPGGGDLGGDGLAQDAGDGGEQVLVDDRVLVRGDAEGGVLVGDAPQHRVGPLVRVVQQVRGEGRDGPREGLALGAGGLVAAVEQVAQQFGAGGEHPGVEAFGDLAEGRADGGKGGADGGGGLLGKHRVSSSLGCLRPH